MPELERGALSMMEGVGSFRCGTARNTEAPMADLILKDVPEELLRRIARSAAANSRTVGEEAIRWLEAGAGALANPSASQQLADLRAFRSRFSHLPPLTQEFVDAAKREGRE